MSVSEKKKKEKVWLIIFPLFPFRVGIATESNTGFGKSPSNEINVPSEDKYAALKDLDHQMKTQMFEKQQQELKQKMNTVEWGKRFGILWKYWCFHAKICVLILTNNHGLSIFILYSRI